MQCAIAHKLTFKVTYFNYMVVTAIELPLFNLQMYYLNMTTLSELYLNTLYKKILTPTIYLIKIDLAKHYSLSESKLGNTRCDKSTQDCS